jgi:2-oxoglutarate ferredoxin oxidoreductase subunit gamma|uniref:Pyruvate ferredoxin oxidoreductase n=1 Tax=Desulfomonile tiedjei TaxID=2358 RepID=A0A7C4ASP7_9BACT
MTEKREIRLAGFGGQGIILAGHILGKAASIYEKKNAVFTQSYGPEARGGSCSADVVVSDGLIHYPKVSQPDVLVLMSQGALETYGGNIKEGGLLVIDEDLVVLAETPANVVLRKVPATRIAEGMGRRIVANIVMLGGVTALASLVSYEAMKESVLSSIPRGTEEFNLTAFNNGYEYGMALLGAKEKPDKRLAAKT